MKNFPHQFNDLNKIYTALEIIKTLIQEETPLKDEIFGEYLTRKGVYTYRDKTLSIDEFLEQEQKKPASNRGYLTVARDIRRLFQLLGFLVVHENKSGELTSKALELLLESDDNKRNILWQNAFMQLGLEGIDGEISNPYRILLKLVEAYPGIETKKLMLALEAENNSEEELERVLTLATHPFEDIIEITGTSISMAKNAVKILPGVAEQLGDIVRENHNAYPTSEIIITEDDISSDLHVSSITQDDTALAWVRSVTSDEIAKDPVFNQAASASVDLTAAIRIRQKRLAHHQEIVRHLGELIESKGLSLFEGKFDCLGTLENSAILFEVKTILDRTSDQEKQTIKGVGQLKYYKYSIVYKQMGYSKISEFLVFSQKPNQDFIEFCSEESIKVIWNRGDIFYIYDNEVEECEVVFDPENYI